MFAKPVDPSSDPSMEYTPHSNPTLPFWLAEAGEKHQKYTKFRSTPSLPAKTQVTVIGAGLTGVACAYWLTEHGFKDIVIVDARGVCEGATGRNAGHLWAFTELPTSDEIQKYGPDAVHKRHNFQFNTVRQVLDTIKKHNIDCDLRMTGAMNVAISDAENEMFKSYMRQFEAMGLNKDPQTLHTYVDAEAAQKYTTSPSSKGGIVCPFAAQVWPAKFVFGLMDIILARGGNLQTRTKITQVKRRWSPKQEYELVTEDRGSFISEHVVYATNAYTSYLIPELRKTIVPTQGQVLATEPVSQIAIPGLTWYDYGYTYLMQRPDGRLIVGGCRNKHPRGDMPTVNDASLEPVVSEEIRTFMKETFPAMAKDGQLRVAYEWTGIMGFTPDALPMIGRLRGNEWIAAGYTGYGMPKVFGAGKAVADMIAGKLTEAEFVPQYAPSRYWPIAKL